MAKTSIDRDIYKEIKYWTTLKNPKDKMMEYLGTVRPISKRTDAQNKALHVDCNLIAEKLNDAGKDMRTVLKQDVDTPWTVETVKKYIYKPIIKALYNKDSTKDLEKNGEIEKVHDVIMRELGEKHGIEYHDFPHDPQKKKEFEDSLKAPDIQYPENNLGDTPF